MKAPNGDAALDEHHAHEFGLFIRHHREAAGLTVRDLAEAVGTDHAQIIRMEKGRVQSPRADLLGRIADTIHVPVEDVLSMAGYPTGKKLPKLRPYLRTTYRDMPAEALDEVEAFIAEVQRRHGNAGPKPGEDE